jgi:hypothetical protein
MGLITDEGSRFAREPFWRPGTKREIITKESAKRGRNWLSPSAEKMRPHAKSPINDQRYKHKAIAIVIVHSIAEPDGTIPL